MAWIKKNLVFVICSGVALVLLGVAGWLLFANMGRDAAIQEELNQELANWQTLNSGPFPNSENIAVAKKEQEKLRAFQKEAYAVIPVATPPPKLSNQQFVNMLGTTISDLRTKAEQAGVTIPQQFDFTFSAQRKSLNFPAGSIESWVPQLNDIEAVCNILFAARVNALDSIQRVAVSTQDEGAAEFLPGNIVSNEFAVYSPYQFAFRGFSAELATVLEEMQRATNFIIVKSVQVVPATGEPGEQSGMQTQAYQQDQYVPRRAGATGVPTYQQGRTRVRGTGPVAETVLSEQPLHMTLLLDVVKLNPAK